VGMARSKVAKHQTHGNSVPLIRGFPRSTSAVLTICSFQSTRMYLSSCSWSGSNELQRAQPPGLYIARCSWFTGHFLL
jgi:hypothetical protein